MEIWKDIPNYEGYYQVSNLGNVRSIDRVIKNRKAEVKCNVEAFYYFIMRQRIKTKLQ